MEGHFKTEKGAGLTIGGIPDVKTETTNLGIKIPKLLSFLAYGNFNAVVKGLDEYPKSDWPPILPVHFGFQIMVGIGFLLAFVGALFWLLYIKWKDKLTSNWFLKLAGICTPLGFIAVEAGWIVTEVGRQPWIIYNIMKTSGAVTPVPYQVVHLILFVIVYFLLSIMAVWLMSRQIKVLDKFNYSKSS